MAYLIVQFYSDVLALQTSMSVILPEKTTRIPNMYPALYLLHGRTGDHTSWMRNTSVERYVSDKEIVIIMPEVHNSYYADMEYGPDYFKFLTEELPLIARSFFHIDPDRESTFICGLSMGGYGAFKAALQYPETYSTAGSFSGPLDLSSRMRIGIENDEPGIEKMFISCFGKGVNIEGSENDLFFLAKKALSTKRRLPILYQCCGIDDFLYQGNRRFLDFCRENSIALTYEEGPGGHDWDYWDGAIKSFLNWLPLDKPRMLCHSSDEE